MELVMKTIPELIIPVSSSTTCTTADEDNSWDNWSPDINWCQASGFPPFDLPSLILPTNSSYTAAESQALSEAHCLPDWSSTSTTPTTEDHAALFVHPNEPTKNESTKEVRLLHLLTAAAEALSGDQKSPHLARLILTRLKELAPANRNPSSSCIERLAAHFTEALLALLDSNPHHQSHHPATASEVLPAFKSLLDMSPCVSFGHLTANQAILEAVAGERRVHILDYDVAEGVQWASLIQALMSRAEAAAATHLRVTAVTNGTKGSATGAQEAGRRLSAFAASVGLPFSFRICRLDQTKRFKPGAVKVVRGEALVVNCVLHAAQQLCSAATLSSFLAGGAALGARILTVVEEESSAGGEEKGFVGEVMDEMERYVAIGESLEAGFPMQGRVREMVERVILRPRIEAAVVRAYGRREGGGEGAAERCGEWMAAEGFERVGLSFFNVCQAQLLLGLFNDGYRVDRDETNKLALSWKSSRLLSASVWGVPHPPSPSALLPL